MYDIAAARGTSANSLRFEPIYNRTLILVAHPDDETGCATLLQRAIDPVVVYCTDGAPASDFFWGKYGSRHQYALLRQDEAVRALGDLGISSVHFLRVPGTSRRISDQELFRELPSAATALRKLVLSINPEVVLAPAYEGGHPDHDSCSFLAFQLGLDLNIPVWEMPLYYRSPHGELIHQKFLRANGSEISLQPTISELRERSRMIATHASQSDLREFAKSPIEFLRPQPTYDYCRPPHPGQLNYEAWQWPITGSAVCDSFRLFQSQFLRDTFRSKMAMAAAGV